MTELIFIVLFGEPTMNNYICTEKQLKKASEVFIPCQKEKHFKMCYETSIKEYCKVKLID